MESLEAACGLWKQVQDNSFGCTQKSENMRRRVQNVHDAYRALGHTRQRGDALVVARDESVLRCHIAELQLSLREMEASSNKLALLMAEAIGQSKMFSILELCPEGA